MWFEGNGNTKETMATRSSTAAHRGPSCEENPSLQRTSSAAEASSSWCMEARAWAVITSTVRGQAPEVEKILPFHMIYLRVIMIWFKME